MNFFLNNLVCLRTWCFRSLAIPFLAFFFFGSVKRLFGFENCLTCPRSQRIPLCSVLWFDSKTCPMGLCLECAAPVRYFYLERLWSLYEVGPTCGNKCVGMRIWRLLLGPWLWIHSAPACPAVICSCLWPLSLPWLPSLEELNSPKPWIKINPLFFFKFFCLTFCHSNTREAKTLSNIPFIPQSLTLAPCFS